MHHNRHVQRRKLHHEYRRVGAEEIAQFERRQQNDGKNDWDRFKDGVKSAWDDLNPFAPKTPTPPSIVPAPTSGNNGQDSNQADDDFSTQAPPPPPAKSTAAPQSSPSPKPTPSATERAPSSSSAPPRASVGLPASVVPTETSAPLPGSTLALATDTPSPVPVSPLGPSTTSSSSSVSAVQTSPVAATASDTKVADEEASSTAAKAGIAFGVIGGVLILFMIIWFVIRKRKQQLERQRLDDERFGDEKFNRDFTAVSASQAVTSARPKTADSAGDVPPPVFPKNTESAWERPTTDNSSHPANPFGNHAETLDVRPVSPLSEIGVATTTPASPVQGSSAAVAAAVAGGVAAGAVAAGAITRKASMRKDLPKPLDLTLPSPPPGAANPSSPANSAYSVNTVGSERAAGSTSPGAAAIAAAGGPVGSAVHRVQLDFKPTMDDELELKAGGLVRLLFEYDDGWALCIRLDRSKQGVVPRTCLSARPVKPRAGPGPRPNIPVNPNRAPGQMGPPQQPQQPMINRGPGSIERKPVPGQAY